MVQPKVRSFDDRDLEAVAAIHAGTFARQGQSREWIAANAGGFPRMRLYVAETVLGINGYVLWTELSGFRKNAVLELEQIAVIATARGSGIGSALVADSLTDVVRQLQMRGASLDKVLVSTRTDNAAQRLYRCVLGAEIEATVPSLFSADEVVMLARSPLTALAQWRERSNIELPVA